MNKYDFKKVEKEKQIWWENQKTFQFDRELKQECFFIDTPPPTISGILHLGHIFSYCHCDFVARFQRMAGKNVFYPIGFDANGLPTERLIEKDQKVLLSDFNQDEIRELFSKNITKYEQLFEDLFRRIGISFDWSLRYNTFEERVQKISQQSLIKLFKNNNLYIKNKPTFWDPVCQTAISQAELVDLECDSHMNYIPFVMATKTQETVMIATTRPEFLPACIAVFFHPDDTRYNHLKDQEIITPFGKKVPFLPDPDVKMDKGSGAVMCCTFGDEQDVVWQQRSYEFRGRELHLPCEIILNSYGKMIENAITKFADISHLEVENQEILRNLEQELVGKKAENARQSMIAFLEKQNLLIKQEKITHKVNIAERSGAKIELLPTDQWYIKVMQYKEDLQTLNQKLKYFPEKMRIKMEQWIAGLSQDWCVSRQRFYGIALPFWHFEFDGKQYVIVTEDDELPIDPRSLLSRNLELIEKLENGQSRVRVRNNFHAYLCNEYSFISVKFEIAAGTELTVWPEKSVLDTWATSALSPHISYGEPKKFDLRHQSHEIIRTWAFFTMVRSWIDAEDLPWEQMMISGWCLSHDGSKMSKSKGNVIDPLKLLDHCGSDVVRFWAASGSLGVDTVFSENVLKQGKRFVTKLLNAAKFVQMHLANVPEISDLLLQNCNKLEEGMVCEMMDHWVLHKLSAVLVEVNGFFNQHDYCRSKELVERFFFDDFCNNFLEFAKSRAYAEDENFTPAMQKSAIYTLNFVFLQILKMFAPFVPFVAEEIWQAFGFENSIHARENWPTIIYNSENDFELSEFCLQILDEVRKFKAQEEISLKKPIKSLHIFCKNADHKSIINNLDLKFVTNSEAIIWNDDLKNANEVSVKIEMDS